MPLNQPIMRVVAGPPGSGKSTAFPVAEADLAYFEADQRAAQLNGGSFQSIPLHIRDHVNRELELFIETHIRDRKSMTFETTLRSEITFHQARRARLNGFALAMTYVALSSVNLHVERVAIRVDRGGHSTAVKMIEETYSASLVNLRRALQEFDDVAVYDNSGAKPELFLTCNKGKIQLIREGTPNWVLKAAMGLF